MSDRKHEVSELSGGIGEHHPMVESAGPELMRDLANLAIGALIGKSIRQAGLNVIANEVVEALVIPQQDKEALEAAVVEDPRTKKYADTYRLLGEIQAPALQADLNHGISTEDIYLTTLVDGIVFMLYQEGIRQSLRLRSVKSFFKDFNVQLLPSTHETRRKPFSYVFGSHPNIEKRDSSKFQINREINFTPVSPYFHTSRFARDPKEESVERVIKSLPNRQNQQRPRRNR